MGSSTYSDDIYRARASTRAATGTPTFTHDADVRAGTATTVLHPLLDIKNKVRESRDSDAHPRSKAIAVIFDDTGSMGAVPVTMQKKLPAFMALLVSRGYCQDPQVLFGCVGDYHTDQAPLQIGQFESGNEMDDAFAAMALEGNGGGTNQESYELALWYFAHRVEMDCLQKRGEKGLLFIIGDERPYPIVSAKQIEKICGVKLQADVPTEQVMADLRQKFEVFFVLPSGTHNYNNRAIRDAWVALVGPERVIKLDDPDAVCESMAAIVGLMEGTTDGDGVRADLAAVGATATVRAAVADGVRALAGTTSIARVGDGTLPARKGPSGAARL